MALFPCGSANGGGGGGSTVVPNPTGEAVGELTSIGIDGNKYSISGGGGAYTTTVLFTNGASGDTTFQLSSAYTNFDAIAIYYSHFDGQDRYEDVRIYPTTFLNSVSSTDEVLGLTNDVWYYYFSVNSTTEFRYVKSNAGYITDIIGIKYGSNSGGGSSYKETNLWTGSGDMLSAFTAELSNPYTDYDALRFEYKSGNGSHNYMTHYERVISKSTLSTPEWFSISDFYLSNGAGVNSAGRFTDTTHLSVKLHTVNWFTSCTLTRIVGIKF